MVSQSCCSCYLHAIMLIQVASHQVLHECSGFDPRQPKLGHVGDPGAVFVEAAHFQDLA